MSTGSRYRPGTSVITLRLPQEMKDEVQRVARSRSVSVTSFIRGAIRQAVAEDSPAFDAYIKRLRSTARQHAGAMQKRRDLARDLAGQIASMLTERFGVASVRLVGSMSRDDALVTEASDIDLLVTGLRVSDQVSAVVAAEQLANGEFSVDLIRREDLSADAADLFFGER